MPYLSPPFEENGLPRRWQTLLLYFLRQQPWRSAGLAFFSCLPCFFDVLVVVATKRIIDSVLAAQKNGVTDLNALAHITLGPMLFFTTIVAGRFLGEAVLWTFSYNTKFLLLQRMRTALFAYVQRHAMTYFDGELSGRVAHKTMLVPEQLTMVFERFVFEFIPSAVFFLVIAAFFFAESPLFSGAVGVYVVVYFALCLWHGRRIAPFATRRNAASTHVTGRIADVITNIKNVIFMSAQRHEDAHVGHYITQETRTRQELYIAIVRLRIVQRLLDIAMWILLFGGAIVAWAYGIITAGGFVMVTTLAGMLLKKAYDVGQIFPDFFDVIGSAQDGIDTILVPHTLRDKPEAKPLAVTRGAIVFENVSFSYENNQAVFRNLNLVIPSGQRVGLIGASGAGKTTLIALLLRLHLPQEGRILIDGHDIADVTQDSLRRQIGLIPQDTMLFHRTLMENIRYGRPEADEALACDAARRAFAHEFIEKLPQTYQTMVGERGVKLSGGQRQRIAIARAFLKNAPILVLDEATSALDSESEAVIQRAMADAMQGRTVIAIAHRLSTIAHLDRLVVLKDGMIAEEGSHRALLAQGGLYAQLWRKQSGGFLTNDAPPASETETNDDSELNAPSLPFEEQGRHHDD